MTDNKKMPNQEGYFGKYGGRYVAETLVPALEELSEKYHEIKDDERFKKEVKEDLEKINKLLVKILVIFLIGLKVQS